MTAHPMITFSRLERLGCIQVSHSFAFTNCIGGQVTVPGGATMMEWVERYRKGNEETLDRIVAERYAVLDIIIMAVSSPNRINLNHSYQELEIVLNELWVFLGEKGQKPYVS